MIPKIHSFYDNLARDMKNLVWFNLQIYVFFVLLPHINFLTSMLFIIMYFKLIVFLCQLVSLFESLDQIGVKLSILTE